MSFPPFVKLPRLALPATEDADRLRQKWAEQKARAQTESFWTNVQVQRQRRLVEDQPDSFVKPLPYDELPIG